MFGPHYAREDFGGLISITDERREEFAAFDGPLRSRNATHDPDPQDPRTFAMSRLRWDDLADRGGTRRIDRGGVALSDNRDVRYAAGRSRLDLTNGR